MVCLQRSHSITAPYNLSLASLLGSGPPSASGERITSETVFALPAFLQGTRLISTGVARCDVFPYKILDNGGREIDQEHNAFWLLNDKANIFQTSYNFLQTLVANALWEGNGYAFVERDDLGRAVALYNLNSNDVYPVLEFEGGRLTNVFYGVSTPKGQVAFAADDIIHIKNVSIHTGTEGIGIINACRDILGLSIAVVKYGATYFKHGSHISKVVKIPGWLNQEQQEQLRHALSTLHDGINNAHKMAFLMGGSELQTLPISNEEAQWLGSRELSLNDVALILGCPVSKLGGRNSVSYGSLEQDNLSFLIDTLDAWLTNIETELTTKLLRPRQRLVSHFIEFERQSLLATDPSYKRSIAELYQSEMISWEEARQRLNLTTNRTGDFVRPNGVTSVEQLEQAQKQAEKQTQAMADAAAAAAEAPPADEQDNQVDEQLERAITLTRSVLGTIKQRIVKSVEGGKIDLSDHSEIIRSRLDGLDAELVIDRLNKLQEELNHCLPEQRSGVIDRLDTDRLAGELWANE